MAPPLLRRLLVRVALLLLVPAITRFTSAEEPERKARDSYLDAYVASHGAAAPPDAAYASPSQPTPGYAAPAPSYGPPPRGYPHPPHHHLHHHAYGPPVMIGGGGGDYGPDNGNGGEMTGGSGGVDIATFLHALGKILVIKIIIKLVAVIIALLFLPKLKEKKKKKKPHHKPHRPQHDDDSDKDEDSDDEDDDDDDRRRRRRALRGKMTGFGTSSGDPRLLDLAQVVLQNIEKFSADKGSSTSEKFSTNTAADS